MVYQNSAMHIMEGLHLYPMEIWFALSLPVVAYGVYKMNRMIKESQETLLHLGTVGPSSSPYLSCHSSPKAALITTVIFLPGSYLGQ